MSESEEKLLSNAVAGDADALAVLLERHGPRVRQSLSIADALKSAIDADDVLQVTYMDAFLSIGRFSPRGAGSFYAWLRRMAENNLRDAVKELTREKRFPPAQRVEIPSGDDSYVALYEFLGATSTTPSRAAARREARSALQAAIEELPRDYAVAVRLYDLEGRPGPEVAEKMNRSRGAIFMLRARGHNRLREILGSGGAYIGNG